MIKGRKGTPLKLYADGNGGIYFDPEEVFNDPEFQRQADEFDAILAEMAREEAAVEETRKSRDSRSDSLAYCNWELLSGDG